MTIKKVNEDKVNELEKVLESQPKLSLQQIADTLKWGKSTVIKYKKIIAERKTDSIINEYGGKVKELHELLSEKPDLNNKQIANILECEEEEVIEYKKILRRLKSERERKIEKVKELREENPNIKYKEIAKILQCSIDVVVDFVVILKDRGEFKTKQELRIEKVEKLLKQDPTLSNQQIGKIINCSSNLVDKYIRILQRSKEKVLTIQNSRKKDEERIKEERIQKIKELRENKPTITYKEIAEILQCTVRTVEYYIRIQKERGEFKSREEIIISRIQELQEKDPEITNKEIATILQCSISVVYRYITTIMRRV